MLKTLLALLVLSIPVIASGADDPRTKEQVTEEMCSSVSQSLCEIERWKDVIKTERANPSGVVDMAVLHAAGLEIQCWQRRQDLAEYDYKKFTGKKAMTSPKNWPACASGEGKVGWDSGYYQGNNGYQPLNCIN